MSRIVLCASLLSVALAAALATRSAAEEESVAEVRPEPGVTAYFHARLVALTKRLAERPRPADLLRAGLGAEHDATERSLRLGFVPPSVGRAAPLGGLPALDVQSDPALVLAAAGAQDAKQLRSASREEVDAELARIDAQIARVNRYLSAHREERAAHYREHGRIPEALEREVIAALTGEGTVAGAADASRWEELLEDEALDARRLDLITAHMNRASQEREQRAAFAREEEP